ncbi:MAG: MFS transporter [Deltaproteobacteria bacterium]|nr:MFS transporter [Deltaproteobacteria bacterium]
MSRLPPWLQELLPILALLLVIVALVRRVPHVDVGHTQAFRKRRFFNWFPVGLTYAFLYMGRYNLNVCKNALGARMTTEDFGHIFGIGAIVYGCSFVLNGPLTDRYGGRATILVAAGGVAVTNVAMGLVLKLGLGGNLVSTFTLLYALNMYFQSFGAVSIVKVNAAWFHLRERGTFGGIFGILISLGIYFAYDWGRMIVERFPVHWVFFVPAAILSAFFVIDLLLVRDTPGQAGHVDFDPADASSGDEGPRLTVVEVAKRMLRDPVIVTIALVEFCSGYIRNAIMQFFPIFAKQTGSSVFVYKHWGMLLCVAGISGGIFAGLISDRVFHSRRGPVSAILYGMLVAGSALTIGLLTTPLVGWVVIFMSLAIIGVHGMLSGTASMDFGGKKNVGVAVGIIDGLVYLGTGAVSLILGKVLPEAAAAKVAANWRVWPLVMLPATVIGFVLALRLWNARPKSKAAPAH